MICTWCKQDILLEDGEEPIRIDLTGLNGDGTFRFHARCYIDMGWKEIFEPFPLSTPAV
jgi:hypothetical protein